MADAAALVRSQLRDRVQVAARVVTGLHEINGQRALRVGLAIPLRFALFLFLPAGTLLWTRGWVFVLVSLAEMTLQFAWLWRVNPEVVVARSHYHADSKRWDKLLLCGYLPVSLAILVIAAFDAGRFHSAPDVWPVSIGGFALFGAGFALITWAQSVNKFFESTVRIQRERGHRVIDTGPYATVRHPGYVGSIFVSLGTALALGSLWALIPAAAASTLLLLRAHWEDQTLQVELAGYQDYAARVRFKVLPHVW